MKAQSIRSAPSKLGTGGQTKRFQRNPWYPRLTLVLPSHCCHISTTRSWRLTASNTTPKRCSNLTHHHHSSSLYAICTQQVSCHGSPSFSIFCHSDAVIIWYLCPFLDVICPHCSRSLPSSSTIYPSFHQQSLYPISSYYMSKIFTFSFFDSI